MSEKPVRQEASRRRRLAPWCAAVAVAAVVVGAFSARLPPWVVAALTSRLSLWCAGIMAASALMLVLALRVLWRAGRQNRLRRRQTAQEGAIVLEFVLVLPFVLMLVLLMVQSSLLMAGNVCVQYAAYCAARSAIVTIPADGGVFEPANVLADEGQGGKYEQARMAAVWAVMPISCGSEDIVPDDEAQTLVEGLRSVFGAYGRDAPAWLDARVARKLQYAMDNTELTVLPPADGTTYGPHEDIRVRVRHVFYLSIPYVGRLFMKLRQEDARELDFGDGEYGLVIHAATSLTNEGVQDYIEEERIE